jgi:hypothetical protein
MIPELIPRNSVIYRNQPSPIFIQSREVARKGTTPHGAGYRVQLGCDSRGVALFFVEQANIGVAARCPERPGALCCRGRDHRSAGF